MGTLSREDMKNSIKMRNYYGVSDVRMVLEDEDFESYTTEFLQYMISVIAPGKHYEEPSGDKMEDESLQSIRGDWSDDEFKDKLGKFLTVFSYRLKNIVVEQVKRDGDSVNYTWQGFNAIEIAVFRFWGTGEEGTRKLNQTIVNFIRKVTDSSDKHTAFGINKCTQFLWQRYYDDRFDK